MGSIIGLTKEEIELLLEILAIEIENILDQSESYQEKIQSLYDKFARHLND